MRVAKIVIRSVQFAASIACISVVLLAATGARIEFVEAAHPLLLAAALIAMVVVSEWAYSALFGAMKG